MTTDIKITSIENPLTDYFVGMSISDEAKLKYGTTDILILPSKTQKHGYVFPNESIDFVKYCRLNDENHKYDILTNSEDINTFVFNSIDLIMPTIYILEKVMLPFCITLVTTYVCEKLKGNEEENNIIYIKIIVNDGEKSKEIQYEGDAKTFSEKIAGIDFEKL